ncbi:VP3 [Rotavirus G chicken/03V0567/DEU/2003]|uniref:VP3 n=1 Tax=Rotavirus G chicken/03V0567/DEU/2003 TaxID=994995 RepID=M4H1Y1_9REOV|nr:VP3 [Rotavirus G chicken/03V0567/DEU/2003]AFL91894.1 VP3 [Rotavirus G chicken/03V0567/DEU/2003]
MAKLIEFSELGARVQNTEDVFRISNSTEKFIIINPSRNAENYIKERTHYVTIDKRNVDQSIKEYEELFPTSVSTNNSEIVKLGACGHIVTNCLHVDHPYFTSNITSLGDYAPTGWRYEAMGKRDDQLGDFIFNHIFDQCNGWQNGEYINRFNYGVIPNKKTSQKEVDSYFSELMKEIVKVQDDVDADSYYYNIQRRQIGTAVRETVFELIEKKNWNVNLIGPEFESFALIYKLLMSNYTGDFKMFTINETQEHNYKKELTVWKKKTLSLRTVLANKWKYENAFCKLLMSHLCKRRKYSYIYINNRYNVDNWVINYPYIMNVILTDDLITHAENSIIFGFEVTDNTSSYAVNKISDKVVYTSTPYADENNAWTMLIKGERIGDKFNKDDSWYAKKNNYSNFVYGGDIFTTKDLNLNYVNIALYSLSNSKNSIELIKSVLSYEHIVTFPLPVRMDWRQMEDYEEKPFLGLVRQNKFEDHVIHPKILALEHDCEIVTEMVFLQLGSRRCIISDMYQHAVVMRIKTDSFYSDKYFSHIGIRQVSVYNRDNFLTSRLNAYVDRQLSRSIDFTQIIKNKFGGFSGHLVAVERYFNQLIYTMSPIRWAKRAFSEAKYKKRDQYKNADGEKHEMTDFINTYHYLNLYYTTFEDLIECSGIADYPQYYIAVKSGMSHITLQLTEVDPTILLDDIVFKIKGVRLKRVGETKFKDLNVVLYQTKEVLQYHIVKILRQNKIACQQSRPYIMHMNVKEDGDDKDEIVINERNVYVKKIVRT